MSFDSNLTTVTAAAWAREQIFENAVALYPELVRNHPHTTSSRCADPKEIFQVLIIRERTGWMGLLVYGVPEVRDTLVRTIPSQHGAEKCLMRLMDTTADLLGSRYPRELGIPSRSEKKMQYGTANRDYL